MALPSRVAALPSYLPTDLDEAPPGHRFQLYLRHWQGPGSEPFAPFKKARPQGPQERALHGPGCNQVLNELCALPLASLTMIDGILLRQSDAIGQLGTHGFTQQAISSAPFTTGLGIEHPIDNGFAFLSPYGLSYLAGSSVKGVVRKAMQELMADDNPGFCTATIDALMGPEQDNNLRRGALDFWDVFPKPDGGRLVVEIMTPHYSEYYQGKEAPHDSGMPIPVSFLAVPAKSAFAFHVVCRPACLSSALQDRWQDLLTQSFCHAFEWVGFGAKTSVGYGAMVPLPPRVPTPDFAVGQAAHPSAGPPETLVWPAAKLILIPATGEIKAVFEGNITAGLKGDQAAAFRTALSADQAAKLAKAKELKNVRVGVEPYGNGWRLVELASQ